MYNLLQKIQAGKYSSVYCPAAFHSQSWRLLKDIISFMRGKGVQLDLIVRNLHILLCPKKNFMQCNKENEHLLKSLHLGSC